MKKCLIALSLLMSSVSMTHLRAEEVALADAPEIALEVVESAEEISAEDAADAADANFMLAELGKVYTEKVDHAAVEAALQEVADANREVFDRVLAKNGVEAQDQDGNVLVVLPIPSYFFVK